MFCLLTFFCFIKIPCQASRFTLSGHGPGGKQATFPAVPQSKEAHVQQVTSPCPNVNKIMFKWPAGNVQSTQFLGLFTRRSRFVQLPRPISCTNSGWLQHCSTEKKNRFEVKARKPKRSLHGFPPAILKIKLDGVGNFIGSIAAAKDTFDTPTDLRIHSAVHFNGSFGFVLNSTAPSFEGKNGWAEIFSSLHFDIFWNFTRLFLWSPFECLNNDNRSFIAGG